jgi:hypothetical protein
LSLASLASLATAKNRQKTGNKHYKMLATNKNDYGKKTSKTATAKNLQNNVLKC